MSNSEYGFKISGNTIIVTDKNNPAGFENKGGMARDAVEVFIEDDFVVAVYKDNSVKVSRIKTGFGGTFESVQSAKKWIRQQRPASKKPKTSKSSSKDKDTELAKFVLIIACMIFLVMSPGILIYDIFSSEYKSIGNKWIPSSLISLGIFLGVFYFYRKDLHKGLGVCVAICCVSSVVLILWWLFFGGSPLSGA